MGPGGSQLKSGPSAREAPPVRDDHVLNGPDGAAAPGAKEREMDRSSWDRIVSAAGAVVAAVLIVLGTMAIYGGDFGRDNVRDRLVPQHISFPPADAMTPEERAAVGEFAGQKVDTGAEAEALARHIAGHLEGVNEGATYSETGAAARAEGLDPDVAAELQAKADTLFKGESLRAMLLNAYGWWTLATIAMWAGFAMVIAGR